LELQDRHEEDGVVEYAYEELSKLSSVDDTHLHYAREMALEFVEVVQERYNTKGQLPGVATGFAELDSMLLGLKPRLLYYVGARPSKGKTALITSIIANICAEGVPVGFLSLESSRKEIMARLFSNIGNIDNQILITGAFEKTSDFGRVGSAAERVYDWPLVICDKENMDLQTIRAKAREMVRTGKARVLFLDYIQLVPQTNYQLPYRLHMNEVSMAFKQLARELEVPVVVAAQLGRDAEGKVPTLADFKETGQIEQDADGAVLIHEDADATWLIVAKNKDGPRGHVKVEFHKPFMRFVDPFSRGAING
jgi:replicative DNA helicase